MVDGSQDSDVTDPLRTKAKASLEHQFLASRAFFHAMAANGYMLFRPGKPRWFPACDFRRGKVYCTSCYAWSVES